MDAEAWWVGGHMNPPANVSAKLLEQRRVQNEVAILRGLPPSLTLAEERRLASWRKMRQAEPPRVSGQESGERERSADDPSIEEIRVNADTTGVPTYIESVLKGIECPSLPSVVHPQHQSVILPLVTKDDRGEAPVNRALEVVSSTLAMDIIGRSDPLIRKLRLAKMRLPRPTQDPVSRTQSTTFRVRHEATCGLQAAHVAHVAESQRLFTQRFEDKIRMLELEAEMARVAREQLASSPAPGRSSRHATRQSRRSQSSVPVSSVPFYVPSVDYAAVEASKTRKPLHPTTPRSILRREDAQWREEMNAYDAKRQEALQRKSCHCVQRKLHINGKKQLSTIHVPTNAEMGELSTLLDGGGTYWDRVKHMDFLYRQQKRGESSLLPAVTKSAKTP